MKAALLILNLLLAFLVLRASLPRLRQALDVSHVEMGEALRLAQHPAGVDPAARMPIGTLAEAAAFDRLSPSALEAWAVLLYAVVVILVFALARELGGDWSGLTAAAAWQKIFLDLPMGSGFLKQFWLTGLGLLAAVALVRHARRPRRVTAAGVGAAFGLTALTRSTYFPFLPLLAFGEAARGGSPSRRLARAALILGLFAFVLTPWVAMNAAVKKRFLPFEYGSGDLNVVAGALGALHGAEGDHLAYMGAPESERGRSPAGWAIRTVLSRPARYLRGAARRAEFALTLKLWLFALALAGLLSARRDAGARALALQCAYFFAVICAMPVEADYFEPFWPLLLALAAAPLSRFGSTSKAAESRVAAGGILLAAVLGGWIAARAGFFALSYAIESARRPPWSEAALDEALARRPWEAWTSFEDAHRRLRLRDAAGAVRVLEKSASVLGDLPRHRLLLAWARAKAGEPADLLALTSPAPPERPAFNDDLTTVLPVYQALALDASGRREQALARIKSGLSSNRAQAHFIHPEEESLAEELEPMLAARADSSFSDYLAHVLGEEDPADVERALRLAVSAEPNFEGWLALGRQLSVRGRKQEAAQALERAEGAAKTAEQLHLLQFRWAEAGDGERSRRILELLTRRFPERALYWSDLGVALYMSGNVSGAEKSFRRALAEEPGMVPAALSLAAILDGRKKRAAPR